MARASTVFLVCGVFLVCVGCIATVCLSRSTALVSGFRLPPPGQAPPPLTQRPEPKRLVPEVTAVPRQKIAVCITVTKDGPYLDGAAVLAQSVLRTGSKYDVEMVAMVHAGVNTTRPMLKRLGFRVIEFEQPITSDEIQCDSPAKCHLKNTIDKSGCCGTLELLKLRAYQLHQYHRVLLLDMDTVVVKNLDHLIERASDNHSLVFTYDHAMDTRTSRAPPVQGGFLLISPSERTFQALISIVRSGDFRPSLGWAGSKIGWCWGGQTVQGLLAYYYTMVEPEAGLAIDPCAYNSMATTDNCSKVAFSEVQSVHFTQCQKPWSCRKVHGICAEMHAFWWKVRQELQVSHGLPAEEQCCGGCKRRHYHELPMEKLGRIFPAL